jgi:hypothetical protein
VAVRPLLASIALVGGVLVASTDAAVSAPVYTRAATQSCLAKLPHAVVGLPPATPPAPTLFVYALGHDDLSTGLGSRAYAQNQLGVWTGDRIYQGLILSFFKSVPAARASLKAATWLYGGKRIRNVIATWDQTAVPTRSVRNTVFGCLRSAGSSASQRRPPRAGLATFAGRWGGHDRGLSVTSSGRGREFGNASCCERVYELGFEILSVRGTLTRATAVYRVTWFRRYESGVRKLRVREVGKLLLRNGIVTDTLTRDFFCSNPAWGATGACGA